MIRRQRVFGLIVVIAGVLVAGAAQAQPGGGGRGRGGFGGPGMGPPGMGGPIMLVQNPAVQKEIGLEGEAVDKVQKIAGEYRDEMMAESERAGITFGGPQQFEGLSPEERETKMREMNEKRQAMMTKLNEKFMPQLKEALTAPQFERVQQIALQAGGSQALTRPDVVKSLEITKEQQQKISAINQEFMKKQNELRPGGRGGRGGGGGGGSGGPPPDFQGMMAKMQELTKERDSKAIEILSKDQQEKFEKMKGKPFDVAQLMQGPGMGRGGRGGPGGPGGPGGAGGGGPGGGPRGAAGRPQKKAEEK
jgi:hypothetical protein